MDVNGYGRYIDEGDGLPRWKLPPTARPKGVKWKYIGEAIRELYPDYGARFVADRLGMPSKYRNVIRYAAMFGIRITRERRREGYREMSARLRRIFKMERARVMGGLPQVTRVNVGRNGVPVPQKFYSLRGKLVNEYGYYYCESDTMVLLYDDNTKRRLRGIIAPNGFTEDKITKKYGITFERAWDEELEA